MAATASAETLSPDEAQRLTEFARACKAAARIVVLYQATHPTIQSALNRVADGGQRLRGQGAATLTVMPDAVWLDGRAPAKPDSSLGELASLLHAHLIGELTLHGEPGPTAWHTFLALLAKAPEVVRADGGIARAWMTSGGGPIDLKLIDYAEVLRERAGGNDSAWNQIIANYLEGDLSNIDESSLGALLELANDTARFKDFTEQFVGEASKGGQRGKKEVVLRVLQALADYTAKNHPEQLDKVLNQISGTLPRLTPDLVVTLITTGILTGTGAGVPGIDLPSEIRARLSDRTVAEFVAHSVERDHGATARLAQAFQALVPEGDKRTQLLEMAELEAANLPIGKQPEFPDLWKSAAGLLTSYSDSNYVSEEYGKELATARAHAIEVERVSDDPPERLAAWLSTVAEKEVRRLDQQVLLDLLTIETRADAWHKVLDSALMAIDQLILLGHVGLAQELLEAILKAGQDDAPFAEQARAVAWSSCAPALWCVTWCSRFVRRKRTK
ncbi:MAG TPA: hypothetical protein VNJ02_15685 [Vicinamibacterales bacterium]|nr:hypothetical protein [Vicinamibacterales bacterium]